MKERNVNFLEKYKSVDKFIRDAYGTHEGVSEYIRLMEQKNSVGARHVLFWRDDYLGLKHIRWIRNQLAHDVSIDSDICESGDYDWICDFYDRLWEGGDALAVLAQSEKKNRNYSGIAVESNNNQFNQKMPKYYPLTIEIPNYSPPEKQNNGKWILFVAAAIIIFIIVVVFK